MSTKLINAEDLVKAANWNRVGSEFAAKLALQLFRFNKINRFYSKNQSKTSTGFILAVLQQLQVKYDYIEEELRKVPEKGPFLTISNHPFGGIEGLILLDLLLQKRPDFKIMANFLLRRIEPIKDFILPVNPFETHKAMVSNYTSIKESICYLQQGGCIGIFPAGEVSAFDKDIHKVTDRKWQLPAIRFIEKAQVPVIPIFFRGQNSHMFQMLARIHPYLRTMKLPSELFNKKRQEIKIRIGNPMMPGEQKEFQDHEQFGRYLRLKTYALGSSVEVKKQLFKQVVFRKEPSDIIAPGPLYKILLEIDNLKNTGKQLLSSGDYEVFCAGHADIPHIMREIARLREITYREVGEGTNKTMDMDEYDLFYDQMFIWHNTERRIIGAYRLGRGDEIYEQFGLKGFYIRSLFKMYPGAENILTQSIELGRSFVIRDYQTKPMSLYLLWKGILQYLIKHEHYRYLLGPVSISNHYSKFSKELIIEFIKTNFYSLKLAPYFEARKPYKVKLDRELDKNIVLKIAKKDINRLDKFIHDVEPNYRMPVLLKKYLQQNAKIVAFNVDPKFNNCIDGLMIQDLDDIPFTLVKFMMKGEENEIRLYKRFKEW